MKPGIWKEYVKASLIVTAKQILHGYGGAFISVANYCDHALTIITTKIDADTRAELPQDPSTQKDLN